MNVMTSIWIFYSLMMLEFRFAVHGCELLISIAVFEVSMWLSNNANMPILMLL